MKKLLLAVIVILLSCSKEVIEPVFITQSYAELNYDKTFQIKLKNGKGEGVSNNGFKWTSTDLLIGKVDSVGNFIARKIGDVKVNGSNGKSSVECIIKVVPYSTMVKEPVYDFKLSINEVKQKETRVLLSEDATTLLYKGESSKIRNVYYGFENNKLKYSAILFANTNEVATESLIFCKERYYRFGSSKGSDGNTIVMFNDDAKSFSFALTVDNSLGLVGLYLPYSGPQMRTQFDFDNILKRIDIVK